MEKRIKLLREQGQTFTEIARLIGKSRKFAWTHSKDVKFSRKGYIRYHKNAKGVLKLIKPQAFLISNNKMRILGHILFDGTMYKSEYSCFARYINTSKELISQFILDMKKVYGLEPTSLEVEKNNLVCYKVTYKSKLLYEDLKKYFTFDSFGKIDEISQDIMHSSKELKIEFLRAFWENEGSITATGRLMADQKNKQLMKQLILLHKELGFDFKLCKYSGPNGFIYKIYLNKRKENLIKFYRLGLFDKSKVTRGKNLGKKKLDVLKNEISKL